MITDAHLDEYRRIRKAAKNLHNRLTKVSVGTRVMLAAAEALGMLSRSGAILLDQESDTSYLMDFALYELRSEAGKNLVQCAFEKGFAENETEQALLEGMANARLKLVEVTGFDPKYGRVFLRNLLQAEDEFELTDIGMSHGISQYVLMERVIPVAGFNMTSGANFPFDNIHRAKLLKLWSKHKKNADRYIAIYEFYLRKGIETLYV